MLCRRFSVVAYMKCFVGLARDRCQVGTLPPQPGVHIMCSTNLLSLHTSDSLMRKALLVLFPGVETVC